MNPRHRVGHAGTVAAVGVLGLVFGCSRDVAPAAVTVENPYDVTLENAPVALDLDGLGLGDAQHVRVVDVTNGGDAGVPAQVTGGTLFFELSLDPGESRSYDILPTDSEPSDPPRVDAFLAVRSGGRIEDGVYVGGGEYERVRSVVVPAELQSDTSWARFGGPVWESDRVGYRSYLEPGRNLVDVFGKRVSDPVLLHAEGDAHFLQPWGTDVLFVGNSLSLGTPAIMAESGWVRLEGAASRRVEIVADGPLRAIVRTTFTELPVEDTVATVVSEQEIRAGDRWTEQRLLLEGETVGVHPATGIVRHPEAADLHTGVESGIFYAFTWGAQAAQGDTLGLAILVPEAQSPAVMSGDSLNHVIRFEALDGSAVYRYLAAWEMEPTGVGSRAGFEDAIRSIARTWAHPVRVERN